MTFIIHTHSRSRAPKSSKKLQEKNREHAAYINSILQSTKYNHSTKRKVVDDVPIQNSKVCPTSDTIPVGGGYRKTIEDYRWRRETQETPDTIAEIERKKSRLAPIYSKGPVQYISPETDLTTLGKKL